MSVCVPTLLTHCSIQEVAQLEFLITYSFSHLTNALWNAAGRESRPPAGCQYMQPIIHWIKIRRTFSEFRTKKDRGSKVAFIFATVPAQFVLGHVLFFLAVLVLTVC